MKIKCIACGEESLLPSRGHICVEYKGNEGSIVELSHSCDDCGALLFVESDVRENRRAWNRFKKQFYRIPLGCEILAMRMYSGLSQRVAGDVFGGGPVAFSKYETDDLIPDAAMVNLIRLAIAHPETVARLQRLGTQQVRINTVVSSFDRGELVDWERESAAFDSIEFNEEVFVADSVSSICIESLPQEVIWVQ